MSKSEDSFNAYMNTARSRVEIAIGRLKGRFRRLQKPIDMRVEFAPKIVAAACVLHNIIEKKEGGDSYKQAWSREYKKNLQLHPEPDEVEFDDAFEQLDDDQDKAEAVRNVLKDYMWKNFPPKTSLKWNFK